MRDLSRCNECRSPLVQPDVWESVGGGAWRVTLRCPECEHRETDTFDRETISHFDDVLEAADREMVSALEELQAEIMREEIDLFCAALAADYVLPSDFGPAARP